MTSADPCVGQVDVGEEMDPKRRLMELMKRKEKVEEEIAAAGEVLKRVRYRSYF